MSEPIYKIGQEVTTPIGTLPVIDITPIKYGSKVADWLYWFGEEPEEKFTADELN